MSDTNADTIKRYIDDLDSEDSSVREFARQKLLALGTLCIEPLVAVMQANAGRRSWEAAKTLIQVRDPVLISVMRQAVTSQNVLIAEFAAKSLLGFRDVEGLLAGFEHARVTVQLHIVVALEQIGDHRVIPKLVNVLQTTDVVPLRYTLIRALGNLGDSSLIPIIQPFTDDPNHHVREHSEVALKRISSRSQGDAQGS